MTTRYKKSNTQFKKVEKAIPLAAQTFSKSYLQFVKGEAPLFVDRGKGSAIWDIDGNKYTDFVNGLLSVVLGYQYPAIDKAIQKQLKRGISFSLSSPLEYELAKLLIKHIPSAEMVRFAKNGSDATSGAVRIARAVTGKNHILVCGYHGWHDWYIGSTTRKLGVPKETSSLTHTFYYNDIISLEKAFKMHKGKVAAVIMEPMSYEEPKDRFLHKVKSMTHKNDALLIFDEIITGFRFDLGGAQKLFGVVPDLSTFGKSMGNGMPISALVGKKRYMKICEEIFFSSTFGGEALSLAASIAVINEIEKKKVIPQLWKRGAYLQNGVNKILKENNLDTIITVSGKPCWQVFLINKTKQATPLEVKSYLQQELLSRGFLWYGQHNMSYSHTMKDVKDLLSAYKEILPKLRLHLDNGKLRKQLHGAPISDVFKVRK